MTYGAYLSPVNLIFRGLLLLFFDITFNFGFLSIDILPDWLGYLFIYWAIDILKDQNLRNLVPITIMFGGFTFLSQFVPQFQEAPEQFSLPFLLLMVLFSGGNLLLYFCLLTYLCDLSERVNCYHGIPLKVHRNVNLIIGIITSLFVPQIFFFVGGVVEGILFLVSAVIILAAVLNWGLVLYHIFRIREYIEIHGKYTFSEGNVVQ